MIKKMVQTLYNVLGFTGLWITPLLFFITKRIFPGLEGKTILLVCAAVMAWTTFNNFWAVACEGKQFSEIGIGDGLIPDTGLKKSLHKSGALCIRNRLQSCCQKNQRELFWERIKTDM